MGSMVWARATELRQKRSVTGGVREGSFSGQGFGLTHLGRVLRMVYRWLFSVTFSEGPTAHARCSHLCPPVPDVRRERRIQKDMATPLDLYCDFD